MAFWKGENIQLKQKCGLMTNFRTLSQENQALSIRMLSLGVVNGVSNFVNAMGAPKIIYQRTRIMASNDRKLKFNKVAALY